MRLFSDLEVLCDEVVLASGLRLPKPVLKVRPNKHLRDVLLRGLVYNLTRALLQQVGMTMMKKGITKRANFDIAQCAPIKFVDASFVPALFVHGRDDAFILPRHSELLFAKYGSEDKNRILVDGGHNSGRPSFLRDSASIFFGQCLQLRLNELGPAGEDPFGGLSGPRGLPPGFGNVEDFGDIIRGGGDAALGADDAEDEEMAAAIAASLADL